MDQKNHTPVIKVDIKNIYPVLLNDVSLHQTPPDKSFISFKLERNCINAEALKLFMLCDGTYSIYNIIKKIDGEYEANNKKTQHAVLAFFQDAEKRGQIALNIQKSKSPQKINITGSYDIHYPHQLDIELTYTCNLQCLHCYVNAGINKNNNFIPTKKLLSLLETLHKQGLTIVELTGGEPLLHPDFFEIFNFCISKFPIIFLFTNGTLITDKIAQKLGEYRQNIFINISLDGSKPEIHDKIRGVKGAFDKTVNAIKLLSKYGLRIRVSMAVFPETRYDIENTLELAKNLCATSFTSSPILPIGRGEKHKWDLTEKENRKLGKYYQELIEKNKGFMQSIGTDELRIQMEKSDNCGAGYSKFTISPTGVIRPCLLGPEAWFSIGNIFHNTPENIFSSPLVPFFSQTKSPNKDKKPCKKCQHRFYCSYCWVRGIDKNMKEKKPCPWLKKSGFKKQLNTKIQID